MEKYHQKSPDDVQIIRKADLENHNKDGGLWIVIHGKVYDVHDFKSQAQCGREILMEYAGKYSAPLQESLSWVSNHVKNQNSPAQPKILPKFIGTK